MAERLPEPSSPTEDKENADPNIQDPKKGKSKRDKGGKDKSKDINSTGNKEDTDKDNEGDEMKEDPEIPTKETISIMVYCEKGVAGPFDFEVNEEHQFSLGASEVFDDVVRINSFESCANFCKHSQETN